MPLGLTDVLKDDHLCYIELLQKAKTTLFNWKKHWLNLFAKVLVVNTLVASLFVYSMKVLLDPSKQFYTEFDKMV